MAYNVVRTVAPADTAVSVDDVREDMRITHTADDGLIEQMIAAATDVIEAYTGRALVTQTVRDYVGRFPAGAAMPLHVHPIVSAEVHYFDASEVDQTLDASAYWLNLGSVPHSVECRSAWPQTSARADAVYVEAVVGDAVDDVPAALKRALRMLAGAWYLDPATVGEAGMPAAVRALLIPYRLWR